MLADIVAALEKAIGDAQSLLPAPSPTPAPSPSPTPTPTPSPPASDLIPQYLLEDSGQFGPNTQYWNQELWGKWAAYPGSKFGNWRDATDVQQGNVPYLTLSIGPDTPIGYLECDVTKLVQKWVTTGHNRGIYLRSESSKTFTAFAQVGGRVSGNPPQLVIDGKTINGTIAGWATSSSSGMDTRASAKLTKGYIGLLHFEFDAESVQSATLRLYITDRHTSSVLTLDLYETDPPYLYVGGHGEQPKLGLAAQVGEDNLAGHPDVWQAGDMRRDNWVTFQDSNGAWRANRSKPAPLGTISTIPTDIDGFVQEYHDDPDNPGRQFMRSSMVHGDGRTYATSSISLTGQWGGLPNLDDPQLAVDPATVIEEMHVRIYSRLVPPFTTIVDGIKGGSIGFDARCGFWKKANGGYIQNTTGNSGSKGTGRKVLRSVTDGKTTWLQEELQGHSMRPHLGACRPSGTPYEAYRPVLMMASHLGPFDNPPYGTEETIRCGSAVMKKGEKHCFEWYLKMNSITGPYDTLGNGSAVHDGVMALWVDGIERWRKTDFAFRCHPSMGINGPWCIWMHGGLTPAAPGEVMLYDLFDYVCTKGDVYIGPRA